MIKRAQTLAAQAADVAAVGSICAACGALTLPIALLCTDISVAFMRHGHGVLALLDPLALSLLGMHALSGAAIFGALLGFGYAIWTGLSFLDHPR